MGTSYSMGSRIGFRHAWLLLVLAALPASADTVRVYITNSAGDNIHVIDPATNKVVQQFAGKGGDSIRFAHGSIWLTFLTGAKVWRLTAPPL